MTTLLGWCLVINGALLAVSTIAMVVMRRKISEIHGKLFALNETDLSKGYFNYLANYKILIVVFNLAPYVALKIMA